MGGAAEQLKGTNEIIRESIPSNMKHGHGMAAVEREEPPGRLEELQKEAKSGGGIHVEKQNGKENVGIFTQIHCIGLLIQVGRQLVGRFNSRTNHKLFSHHKITSSSVIGSKMAIDLRHSISLKLISIPLPFPKHFNPY